MSAPFPFTGFVDFEEFPAFENPAVRNIKGQGPAISIRDVSSRTWFDWLSKLTRAQRQIRLAAVIDFPNANAQTRQDVTYGFPVPGVFVPKNSFVQLSGPLDAISGAPVAGPANTHFSARMWDDEVYLFSFNNYSSGAIDPGPFGFELLITLQR